MAGIELLSVSHPIGLDDELLNSEGNSRSGYLSVLHELLNAHEGQVPADLVTLLEGYTDLLHTSAVDAKRLPLNVVASALRDANYLSQISGRVPDENIIKVAKKHLSFWQRLTKTQQLTDAIATGNELFLKSEARMKLPEKHVAMVANMSAGKSSVINGILGFRAMKTKATVATGRVTEIVEKPFNDNLVSRLVDGKLKLETHESWRNDDQLEMGERVKIGSGYKYVNEHHRTMIADTPGINSYKFHEHAGVTQGYLQSNKVDEVVHLMDLTQMATDDEINTLQIISENAKQSELVVGINKVDMIQTKDEQLQDFIDQATNILEKNKLQATVVPVSARVTDLKIESDITSDEDDVHDFTRAGKRLAKVLGTESDGLGNLNALMQLI